MAIARAFLIFALLAILLSVSFAHVFSLHNGFVCGYCGLLLGVFFVYMLSAPVKENFGSV
jgi:hypothetical protein